MRQDAASRSNPAALELLDGADGPVPRVITVAVTPDLRLRSPIMEHRRFVPPPPDDDRPTFLVPSLRVLAGPSGFALLIAIPLLLVATWQVAVVGAALVTMAREIRRRSERATFSFSEGFLSFRSDLGWPQGVQEDDDVRWNWRPLQAGGTRG